MKGAWREVQDRLIAAPPLTYGMGCRSQPSSSCLVHSAVPAIVTAVAGSLVRSEIYYYADLLMAARHAFYDSGYQSIGQEQQLTLAKIQRMLRRSFMQPGSSTRYTRMLYPEIVDYVHREYQAIGALEQRTPLSGLPQKG